MYRYAGWVLAVGALAYAACYYYAREMTFLPAVGYVALGVTMVGAVLMVADVPEPPDSLRAFPVARRQDQAEHGQRRQRPGRV